MNADEITFGCEFEVFIPEDKIDFRIGGYHSGIQIPQLPEGWLAERDGSIHADPGCKPVEIVSPILKGADGIRQILLVGQFLAERGAKVNISCGFHVHVGFDRRNRAALARLVATVANHEKGIYAVTGSVLREAGPYCRTMFERSIRRVHENDGLLHDSIDRYRLLNLTNIAEPGGKPTVEFRAFAGTIDAITAIAYVKICVGFVERSIKDNCPRCFGRKIPKSVVDGQSAAKRMLAFLGWGKDSAEYGAIGGFDTLVYRPIYKKVKKTIRDMAKKYDDSRRQAV
jgi:hypothetical protein